MSGDAAEDRDRRTAIIVGVLFIIATVFFLIGGAIYSPSLESPDFLENAYSDRGMVRLGVLVEFFCVLAIPLIAVFLFPVLRRFNEVLAVAYVVFRSLEVVFLFWIEAKLLSLIDVSQDFLDGGRVEAARLQAIGDATLAEIDAAFGIYVLVFAVGALFLYAMLYNSRLVPRWLSAWGFAVCRLNAARDVAGYLRRRLRGGCRSCNRPADCRQ